MPEKRLGLDIQPDTVQAVVVKRGLKEPVILAHTKIHIQNADIAGAVSQAVEQLSSETDLDRALVCACVESSPISFRQISVPFSESKKIRQMLPFELETLLPFRAEEIVADFTITGKSNQTNCLCAIMRDTDVQKDLDLFSSAPVSPEILAVEGTPAAMVLAQTEKHHDRVVIKLAPTHAVFSFISQGQILTCRRVSGNFQHNITSLCQELAVTAIGVNQQVDTAFAPDSILITGDVSLAEEQIAQMENSLDVKVLPADIKGSAKIVIDGRLARFWEPGNMDQALGLCLMDSKGTKGFNLRQGAFAVRRRWDKYRAEFLRLTALAAVLVLFFLGHFLTRTYALSAQVKQLDTEIAQVFSLAMGQETKSRDPLRQLKMEKQALEKSLSMPGENGRETLVIDILRAVSEHIAQDADVKINTFIVSTEGIQLGGETDTYNSVDMIKSGLDQVDFFEKVTIVSADIDKSTNFIRFRIKGQISS